MLSVGTTPLNSVKYCSKSGPVVYYNDTAFLMQPFVLPRVNHELRFPFHAFPKLQHRTRTRISSQVNTWDSLCLPRFPLLIPPPSCLIWKGCSLDLIQVISRCHLILLFTSHGGEFLHFPRIPACLAYYLIMAEHFLQQLPKKASWEANFWDLSCLCENRLILLLHLADNLARYRTSDWRLFSLKFGGKSSMSCMFHYCS